MHFDLSAVIVAVLSSGAISTLVTQICNSVNKKKEAKSGTNQAMRLIIKDRIRFLAAHYIEIGEIYEDELEDVLKFHDCYKALNGNGFLDTLMDKVKSLPVKGVGRH